MNSHDAHASHDHGHCHNHAGKRRAAGAEPEAVPPGTIWTCPMHPEVRQDHPGACPICGMALEPEIASADAGPSAELVDMGEDARRRRAEIDALKLGIDLGM